MILAHAPEEIRVHQVDEATCLLARRLGLSPFLVGLLRLQDPEFGSASEGLPGWLSPDLEGLLRALPLTPSERKARELFEALPPGGRAVVYGDYDVDGLTSTTLALELLLLRGASVRYFIPHRFNQGYGFHESVVRTIASRGCDLLVVVDCGTKDLEAVREARRAGIPVVIFDHHQAGEVLPEDAVLVNPHAEPESSPGARQLCAAGVLWVWASRTGAAPQEWLEERLDLVCLATLADCVNLKNPLNRSLVRRGLRVLRAAPRRGLRLLLEKLDLQAPKVDEEDLTMKVIPCLNAAGRLDLAEQAVRLLHPGDEPLDPLVRNLVDLNQKRRFLSGQVHRDARGDGDHHVHQGNDWPVGVLSSVASRLCSERGRPVALVAPTGTQLRGTLRMPEGGGGDAVAVLQELSSDLAAWGGHRQAAGFAVEPGLWGKVRPRLEQLLRDVPLLSEPLHVLAWPLEALTPEAWAEAEVLRPFGMGNPSPLFLDAGGAIPSVQPLGKTGKVFKVLLGRCELVAFDEERLLERVIPQGWIYRPRQEVWRGRRQLRLYLERIVQGAPVGSVAGGCVG